MNRIVCVGQSATVTLPPSYALLEARVAQKISRILCVEDASWRQDGSYKGGKDYYSGNFQF